MFRVYYNIIVRRINELMCFIHLIFISNWWFLTYLTCHTTIISIERYITLASTNPIITNTYLNHLEESPLIDVITDTPITFHKIWVIVTRFSIWMNFNHLYILQFRKQLSTAIFLVDTVLFVLVNFRLLRVTKVSWQNMNIPLDIW